VRLQQLASPKKTLRLLLVTNNSGILLLATGGSDEPSLYQWGEEEGLCSRYVTAMTLAGEHVALAVHGCVHVAPQRMLVERPEELSRWGRIHLPEVLGPSEHNRIPALCEHSNHLYIGTSAGLYRVPLAALETAASDSVEAERLDDAPIRHLASLRNELWVVHGAGVGRYFEVTAQTSGRYEVQEPESRIGVLRSRFIRPRSTGRAAEPAPVQQLTSPWRRWRFVPENRWRVAHAEPECRQVLSLAASPEGIGAGGEAGRVLLMANDRWSTEIVARLRRPPEVHSIVYDPENQRRGARQRRPASVRAERMDRDRAAGREPGALRRRTERRLAGTRGASRGGLLAVARRDLASRAGEHPHRARELHDLGRGRRAVDRSRSRPGAVGRDRHRDLRLERRET
jgi:hypothetical protein